MVNTQVNVRCSDYMLELMDGICTQYGFTRAELMRTATLNYCRDLLATDTLKTVCDMVHQVDLTNTPQEKLLQLEQLQEMAEQLSKKLGVE